ncbi:hypothetical protein J1P26_00480 [Neobacillus sp. MM2021_6]|uniref:hypothetical protein n=1 Tax=Bacillaceae TaxID=186817 RepID=UPI00140A29C5|nr:MULTISPECIES: hypothetical protein [Bacillaceae]MBO0958192.1 hypothetical protein [Neobacillus sp. MM2021_6]NHC18528.1 hypothetical protein [Bacillus sp. MM2020_4]
MNKPLSEKEKLLSMLTEIYDQLEELESVLEASFSDLRINLNREQQEKISAPAQRLSDMEYKIANDLPESNLNQIPKPLKLELGF